MMGSDQSIEQQDSPLVLVVDDAEDTMRLVVKTLQVAGYRTLWAEDGATGLVIAEKYQPDAIILDIQMPDMDGFTVCEQLKSRMATADIPVLFLSGMDASDEVISRCYQAGAHDLVGKPVRRVFLVSRLQVVLRERALREVYKRLATQDPQTGLDNRRQTFMNITDAIISTRRDQSISALLLGDINNLASINQKYGFEFGDEVILTFGRILKRFSSPDCKIGRIAGDTLAVVLKNTTIERAREFCARVERTFTAIAFDAATSPKHFNTSFGIACYDGKDAAFDADEFMVQADTALAKSKQSGRGNISAYWELQSDEIAELAPVHARKSRRERTNRAFVSVETDHTPANAAPQPEDVHIVQDASKS